MRLSAFLTAEQDTVVERWFEAVLAGYPAETAGFLRREEDPFANPVGVAFRKGLKEIVEGLFQPELTERVKNHLDHLLKMRAVQDFSPSGALGFLLQLKPIVRELWGQKGEGPIPREEWLEFEARVDGLVLTAVDLYAESRERLYRIRVKELQNSIPRIYREATLRTCVGAVSER